MDVEIFKSEIILNKISTSLDKEHVTPLYIILKDLKFIPMKMIPIINYQ